MTTSQGLICGFIRKGDFDECRTPRGYASRGMTTSQGLICGFIRKGDFDECRTPRGYAGAEGLS